jgi:predicted transcriptional regulator
MQHIGWTALVEKATLSSILICDKGSHMATPAEIAEIAETLESRVVRLAEQRRCSPDSIIREAIQQYLAREEARESFRQEAVASWTAYQETGRHLTGQEVQDWLAGWGSDRGMTAPKCHK